MVQNSDIFEEMKFFFFVVVEYFIYELCVYIVKFSFNWKCLWLKSKVLREREYYFKNRFYVFV